MEFDPRSPAFRADPYPFYDMLRSFAPIFYWEPWGLWFLTAHEDCQALLRDDRLGHHRPTALAAPPAQAARWRMQANRLLTMNPPAQTRLRGRVEKALTPGRHRRVDRPRRGAGHDGGDGRSGLSAAGDGHL